MMHRSRQRELVEEDARESRVVVLSRMQELLGDPGTRQRSGHDRRFDELWARAHDADDERTHFWQKAVTCAATYSISSGASSGKIGRESASLAASSARGNSPSW